MLKVLLKGNPISLYEYVDFKTHYYYQLAQAEIIELYYADDDVSFRQQLQDEIPLELSAEQQKKLSQLPYKSTALIKFAEKINTNTEYNRINQLKKKDNIDFVIGAGVGIQSVNLKSSHEHFNNLQFPNTYISPVISAGIDYWIGNYRKRLGLRADVSYYQLEAHGHFTKQAGMNSYHQSFDYQFEQKTIATSLGFIYNLVEQEKFRLYAGAGMSVHFSSYPVNVYKTRMIDYNTEYDVLPLQFRKTWPSGRLQAGMNFSNKIDFNIHTTLGGGFSDRNTSETGNKIFLRLGYCF